MGPGVVRLDGDWTSLIEGVHADASSDQAWAEEIVDRASRVLKTSEGVGLTICEHNASCTDARYRVLLGPPAVLRHLDARAGLPIFGVEGLRRFYYPPQLATTHDEIERGLPEDIVAKTRAVRRSIGLGGVLGVISHPAPGIVIVLFAAHAGPLLISRAERNSLTRVALHLETSFRLRLRGKEVIEAELDESGRVLASRAANAARAVARARNARKKGGAAIDYWPALVDGHLSLVERQVGTRRRYLLIENAPDASPYRAFTKSEIDVVWQAARGVSAKMISYGLGISPSRVSVHLGNAASKLGVASRVELIRLASMLTRDPRSRFSEASAQLTASERDVLDLLRKGLSNNEIALARSRSVRTIANQVASLLRKTKTTSRRALVAHAE